MVVKEGGFYDACEAEVFIAETVKSKQLQEFVYDTHTRRSNSRSEQVRNLTIITSRQSVIKTFLSLRIQIILYLLCSAHYRSAFESAT